MSEKTIIFSDNLITIIRRVLEYVCERYFKDAMSHEREDEWSQE